jgi:hypothetical protein
MYHNAQPQTHLKYKDPDRQHVKGRRIMYCGNTNQKKAKIAILISGKLNFQTSNIIKNREKHYIMTKQ